LDCKFDQSYLAALKSRDPAAEEHLVSTFRKLLWLKLRARLHSPELIEDACQEALLRVFTYFRSGKTLEFPERLPSFVLAVANNVALELLRAERRHDPLPENAQDPPDYLTPEMQAVTQERKLLVQKVLAGLSKQDRDILRLIFLQDEDRDEVCRKLGVDRSYLRVLLHRAKPRFRELLEETELRAAAAGARLETNALPNSL
jgi:RNA polymerase sigma-70 factor, ECF subfamily